MPDIVADCWHRPGPYTRNHNVTCRHCGVIIEYCPCVNETFRKCDPNCRCCRGSMWVAVARSRTQKLREYVAPTFTPDLLYPDLEIFS
jgi:hypothetical protein